MTKRAACIKLIFQQRLVVRKNLAEDGVNFPREKIEQRICYLKAIAFNATCSPEALNVPW